MKFPYYFNEGYLSFSDRYRLIVPFTRDSTLGDDRVFVPFFAKMSSALRKFRRMYLTPFNFSDSKIPVEHIIPYLRLFIQQVLMPPSFVQLRWRETGKFPIFLFRLLTHVRVSRRVCTFHVMCYHVKRDTNRGSLIWISSGILAEFTYTSDGLFNCFRVWMIFHSFDRTTVM